MAGLRQFGSRDEIGEQPRGALRRSHHRESIMIKRRPYFRNSLDMSSKVQVKVLRRRLKLSDAELATIVRKTGNSISAISKEVVRPQ